MASNNSSTPTRRNRYTRASTTSVTQLLSDSCSSLLQRLTTRVRGPSATSAFERTPQKSATTANIPALTSSHNNATSAGGKTKFEDKYTYVLDRIYGRRREQEKTLEPSVGRTLTKSATTSNVLLSEKAYPYVSTNNAPFREKTPYRNEPRVPQQYYHHYHTQQPQPYVPDYPEPPYSYVSRDSLYRVRHRSNHSELRPRRSSKPQRTGKSELPERKASIAKLHPVEIPLGDDGPVPVHAPTAKATLTVPDDDEETTPTPTAAGVPDAVSEREAKRKEIQSLIMKYSALDEAYNRTNASAAATIAQKYYPRLTAAAVSNGRV